MKRSIDFSDPQIEWLRKEAERLGITLPEYVRRIIDAERDRKERKNG